MEQDKQTPCETLDVQDELKKFKEENTALNRRLLGVNELARLLQEKTEFSSSLEEKNKRLEIAVVRLENRCSNLEKKMKTGQYSSLPSNPSLNNPKSLPNSPFIPGPSRQILESLMKENHELKKTINNLTKGGPVGYKEAVKMNHLEEVIDQKNEKIELLQKQIETLTSHDEDGSKVIVDPGLLKRQLLKMEQAMKVKDRFCTLLSDRVSQLEKDSSIGRESNESEVEPTNIREEVDLPSDPTQIIRDLEVKEKKGRMMVNDLQSQVEKERSEKKEALSKAEESKRRVSSLESEIGSLNREIESLSTYNNTLVSEKMDLSGDIMRLNDKLQQYQNELKKQKEEFGRILKDNVADLEDERDTLRNQLFEVNCKLGDLQNRAGMARFMPSMYTGPGIPSGGLGNFNGQEVTADGTKSKPELPQHCGSSMVTHTHREMLTSRAVDTDGPNTETTVPSTATTPTVTSSVAGPEYLRYRTPAQTPGGYAQHPSPHPLQQPLTQQQFSSGNLDGSQWGVHYPPPPQSLPLSMNQQPMSLPPYHNLPQGQPHTPYGGGNTVFGSGMQQTPFGGTGNQMPPQMHPSPGSGYITHLNSEYQTQRGSYYGSNAQAPIQRRQSPPNNNGSNQHYHTGQ